jgi:Tol biopolymer transport system component
MREILRSLQNADGSVTNVTNHPSEDAYPSLSPDGSRILCMTLLPNHNWEVYVMNADGSNVRPKEQSQ